MIHSGKIMVANVHIAQKFTQIANIVEMVRLASDVMKDIIKILMILHVRLVVMLLLIAQNVIKAAPANNVNMGIVLNGIYGF